MSEQSTEQQPKQRGRKPVEGSKNQLKKAAQAERLASGVAVKRGRAVNPNSKRQLALTAKATKITPTEVEVTA